MPITIERNDGTLVPPSTELRARLAAEGKPVLVNFSRGKDSIATFLALRDAGVEELVPVHKSAPPGLSFVNESLDYLSEKLGVWIWDFPSYGFYRMINHYVFQPPWRCAIIDGTYIPDLDREQYDNQMRKLFDVEDMWIVDGVRGADSMTRRMAMKVQGPVQEHKRRMSPIWDWTKNEVMARIEAAGIELPIDYEMFGRSFDALRYDSLRVLRDKRPHDFGLIREWFPCVDMEMLRGDLGMIPGVEGNPAAAEALRHATAPYAVPYDNTDTPLGGWPVDGDQ